MADTEQIGRRIRDTIEKWRTAEEALIHTHVNFSGEHRLMRYLVNEFLQMLTEEACVDEAVRRRFKQVKENTLVEIREKFIKSRKVKTRLAEEVADVLFSEWD